MSAPVRAGTAHVVFLLLLVPVLWRAAQNLGKFQACLWGSAALARNDPAQMVWADLNGTGQIGLGRFDIRFYGGAKNGHFYTLYNHHNLF